MKKRHFAGVRRCQAMSEKTEKTKGLREKIIGTIKKVNPLTLIKIARILGIPIKKDP